MLQFGERLVVSLGFVLALGVLLVIGNTIRLAIENRRSEIEIIKLVGGTDRFVRRPFLYLGFWYGAGGALVAWLLLQGSLLFLSGPVEILAQSYRDDFALSGLSALDSLAILLGGSGLGILGAIVAVRRHLREIEPE
jgi:cell division transport system permease protein